MFGIKVACYEHFPHFGSNASIKSRKPHIHGQDVWWPVACIVSSIFYFDLCNSRLWGFYLMTIGDSITMAARLFVQYHPSVKLRLYFESINISATLQAMVSCTKSKAWWKYLRLVCRILNYYSFFGGFEYTSIWVASETAHDVVTIYLIGVKGAFRFSLAFMSIFSVSPAFGCSIKSFAIAPCIFKSVTYVTSLYFFYFCDCNLHVPFLFYGVV